MISFMVCVIIDSKASANAYMIIITNFRVLILLPY